MMKPTELTLHVAGPESEISKNFIQYMINRMMVSYHKYGLVSEANIDCLKSAKQRIDKYVETGNTEWLVDAANFLMMEFMHNPDKFQSTDSDASPGRTTIDGDISLEPN